MCGIAGFVGEGSREQLSRAIGSLAHRGPDDRGLFIRGPIGFAHARLSIIDVSPAGHQPMLLGLQEAPQSVITFNGEIYNFKVLRQELERRGRRFSSGSDTEVILQAYLEYGEDCFEKLDGMFAIALYDFKKETLILARDRMGEKPLYWTTQGKTLWFASELKGLFAAGAVERKINLASLSQYLLLDYVPTPDSIVESTHKLPPATLLVYEKGNIRLRQFWTPPRHSNPLSERDALARLDEVFTKSVAHQSVADVPLGVFLSGGIDSSTVAYYAQKNSTRPVETFSIGFEDASFDESTHARSVATRLGTHHHERIVAAQDVLHLVGSIPDVFDEPVADASVLPTLLLSQFARERVTVALGGDGGDELFAGYPTFRAEQLFTSYNKMPRPLRVLAKHVAEALPASHSHFPLSYNLKKFTSANDVDPLARHLKWLGSFSDAAYKRIVGESLQNEQALFEHARQYMTEMAQQEKGNQLLWLYARTYLMDQVLVKVDRASMRHSLEVRAPILDRSVVEFAFSLPYDLKYHRGTSKYLLKKLMEGKLPTDIIKRKKKGFGVPLARWLVGPLRPLCEELLSPHALRVHGLFEEGEVARLMQEHFDLRRDNRKELWNLMVFQLWYNRWIHV
jgi:asparagine synthase (glutamine-hydrolysing)